MPWGTIFDSAVPDGLPKQVPLELRLRGVKEAAAPSCGERTFWQQMLPRKARSPPKRLSIFKEQ